MSPGIVPHIYKKPAVRLRSCYAKNMAVGNPPVISVSRSMTGTAKQQFISLLLNIGHHRTLQTYDLHICGHYGHYKHRTSWNYLFLHICGFVKISSGRDQTLHQFGTSSDDGSTGENNLATPLFCSFNGGFCKWYPQMDDL